MGTEWTRSLPDAYGLFEDASPTRGAQALPIHGEPTYNERVRIAEKRFEEGRDMGKRNAPSQKKLVKYFKRVAKTMGKAPKGAILGKECYADGQAFYSLYWYFRSCVADDLDSADADHYAPVLDAYLGGRVKGVLHPPAIDERSLRDEEEKLASLFPQSEYPLNERQVEAVHKALHYPVSIIKGPPGTGKTETILRIVALALERGETVAVTSTNVAAVKNVEEKVEKTLHSYGRITRAQARDISSRDLAFAAASKHVALGSKTVRESACDPLTGAHLAFDAGKHVFADGSTMTGWEKNKEFGEFTGQFPFITSTIHSLKKCFCDGEAKKYDLLIMDEASQTNLMVGIVALSCARRVVLVGDEEQLPPVLSDADLLSAREIAEGLGLIGRDAAGCKEAAFAPYDMGREDFSFLESCYEVFSAHNPGLRTMLVEHYRCHPAIIGFCNEAVYGGELVIGTNVSPDAPPCPIRILWYEGDYRERVPRLSPREEDPKRKNRATCVNRKQMAIMREEEGLQLRRFAMEGKSICILAPFNGQIGLLQTFVRGLLKDVVSQDDIRLETDGEEGRSSSDPNRVYALTIHKSQGQEFDVVYLLPVEDGNWEWPWSQGRRLVNVAASRAKQELRVIISTKLMSADVQEWLTGRQAYVRKPAKAKDDPGNQQMFVRKLVDYTRRKIIEAGGDERGALGEFGFHRSAIRSIFDEVPFLQNPRKKHSDFAPEQCMERALCGMDFPGLAWAKHVSFGQLLLAGAPAGRDALDVSGVTLGSRVDEWYKVPDEAHFDFVIFDERTRGVVAAIEVDGAWHRFKKAKGGFDVSQIASDDRKDHVVRDVCGATLAWLGLIRDGSLYRGSSAFAQILAAGIHGLETDEDMEGESPEGLATMGLGDTDYETLRLATGWDDWIRFPSEIRPDSPFLLLRIPSDGSTFWETDALRDQAKRLGAIHAIDSGYAPPTIEEYVRAQSKVLSRGNARMVYVSDDVQSHTFGEGCGASCAGDKASQGPDEAAFDQSPRLAGGVRDSVITGPDEQCYLHRDLHNHGGANAAKCRGTSFLSITQCLEEWRKDERLARQLEGVTAKRMNECLVAAGFQRVEGSDGSRRVPTELGESIGMSSRKGMYGAKEYTMPVYSQRARDYLAARLGEIIRPSRR